jgi:Chemotaxis signal transduction protein
MKESPVATRRKTANQSVLEQQERRQFLTFLLGEEVFAIGILVIKEIIEYGNVTAVPMMPGFVRGVINLRGSVVPVVDLSARFGRKPVQRTRRTCIIIIEVEDEGERQDIGLVVDAVNAVVEIADDQIEPPPAFGARIRSDFIEGMGKVNDKFVIILNADKVLSTTDLSMLRNGAYAWEEHSAAAVAE